jgi:hypothetical protein
MTNNLYMPIANVSFYRQAPDFFARRTHFIDHLAPIWNCLDDFRGKFYVPEELVVYASSKGIKAHGLKSATRKTLSVAPPGMTPIVCAAYNDLEMAYNAYNRRPLILMEHGVGLCFSDYSPGYAGGMGLRKRVCLFLAPNKYIRDKTARTFPTAPQAIIGTPKMDPIVWNPPKEKLINPTIAVSFHWDGKMICPEAGNALAHYIDILPELAKRYKIIGHGHPKIIDKLLELYDRVGITDVERDFDKVMEKADIYINDASSTAYEFCITGKPTILLNAPWFDRKAKHGIRFWDYTGFAPHVNEPSELFQVIDKTIEDPTEYETERRKMVKDLYPFVGSSAQVAATAIQTFMESKR